MRRLALLLALAACGAPSAPEPRPGEWPELGGSWRGEHYSSLARVDDSNAERLGFAWEYEARSRRGRVEHGQEATPIVVGGVLYVAGPWGSVFALDARTGSERWRYDPELDGSYARHACCDVVNRGVAVGDGRVYVGTLDGFLVALDAATGRELWRADTLIERGTRAYTITGPPKLAKDVVVIGNSGADFGVRGYLTGYDPESGEQEWRFFTVPGDPARGAPESPALERALATWDPASDWKSGLGGTVFGELVYDPELELLYAGTGNGSPYPSWLRSPSGGDNLYLASILALDPDDGELVWHYQTTPAESWDYTATQNMVLAELEIGGRARKVILQAPKNGFFYVLDRATGEFLSAKPYVFANWASAIDASGRPIANSRALYRKQPAIVFPAQTGAHNWQPMAWSPATRLAYIPAREEGMAILNEPFYRFAPGGLNRGANALFGWALDLLDPAASAQLEALRRATPGAPPLATRELLIAWDPVAQAERWRVPVGDEAYAGGGVLATAGNLVVQGRSSGKLVVYRADTGHALATLDAGTAIMAAPASYELDGEQYVAVVAGLGGMVAALHPRESAAQSYENYGRVLAWKLGGGVTPLPPPRARGVTPDPPVLEGDSAERAARGAALFARHCARCHAARGEARLSSYPDLFRLSADVHARFDAIVRGGALAPAGMASFADVLSEADARALHSYLVREQALLRREEQGG